jgi:hypothetical protein
MAIEIDFMKSYDLESIAAEMRRIARKLGKQTLTWDDIDNHGHLSPVTVKRKFGTMQKAHAAADLVPPTGRLTDAEILKALVSLWKITGEQSGRSPLARELKEYGSPAKIDLIMTRFGSWRLALAAAATIAPASLTNGMNKFPRPPRRPISMHTRFLIFKRDLYICQICRRAGGVLEVDHVKPRALGGSDKVDNLQTLCSECNRGKSDNLQ